MDVMVPPGAPRMRGDLLRSHRWTSETPLTVRRLLMPASKDTPVSEVRLWVVEPELLFIENCHELSFGQGVLLGWELCGHYRKATAGDSRPKVVEAGFSKAAQLTTPEKIRAFLDSVPKGLYGVRKAETALPHVRAGARSPLEAAVAFLLVAPPEVGGFGLPEPMVNGLVPLPPRLLALTAEASFEIDLVWERPGKPPLVVEIDGYGSHRGALSRAQAARDALKQNEVVRRSMTVYRLAGTEVTEPDRFRVNALNIAEELEFSPAIDDDDWQDAFDRLHAEVMNQEYVPSAIYDVPEALA